MMMPTSNIMVSVLISKNEITTSGVGWIRVRPVSTTKVRKVDSRARPTANGARNLLRGAPLDSANVGSSDGAEVSALVIPAKGKRVAEGLPLAGNTDSRLMHSYHNVAKLRQFRGVSYR